MLEFFVENFILYKNELLILAERMESGSKELADKMAQEEEQRRLEAEAMQNQLESQKKQQGNAITDMFDRLKMENDHRYRS